MFVGMTLVCLIVMGLCMFGLTTADGFHHGSLSLGSTSAVRYGMKRLQSPTPRE